MKQTLLFAALGLAAFGAGAQEVGQRPLQRARDPAGAGAAPGLQPACADAPPRPAAAGCSARWSVPAIGSTIGHGSGQAAAIVAGTLIGAVVGNNVEAGNLQAQAAAQSMP